MNFNVKTKKLFLNFNEWVKKGSPLNYQLISKNRPEEIKVQFGLFQDHVFHLDICDQIMPLTAILSVISMVCKIKLT